MASTAYGVPIADNLNFGGYFPSVADMTVSAGAASDPYVLSQLTGSAASAATGTNWTTILWGFLAVVLLLWALKFASEHERSGLELGHVRIGVYNFIAVTIMVILGLNVAKVFANKWGQIPGLSPLINNA